ncbi:MAG: hypothetical protein LBL06_04115, partial [Treponema sp.]|nr:hypothetical protein [Treponema sp.]
VNGVKSRGRIRGGAHFSTTEDGTQMPLWCAPLVPALHPTSSSRRAEQDALKRLMGGGLPLPPTPVSGYMEP